MENFMPDITPNFIKNKQGEQIGVFMEMQDYEKLMEKLEDLYLVSIARSIKAEGGETKTLEEIKQKKCL